MFQIAPLPFCGVVYLGADMGNMGVESFPPLPFFYGVLKKWTGEQANTRASGATA